MVERATTLCAASVGAILLIATPPFATTDALAAESQSATVTAELVADVNEIEPGRAFRIGVRLKIAPGWCVSWINPGDAGLAPAVGWSLPDDFTVGLVDWPHPERLELDGRVLFGYEREVVLSAKVVPPEDLDRGTVHVLGADVSWLAIGDRFVPGRASLSLELPTGEASVNFDASEAIESAVFRRPVRAATWRVTAWHLDDKTIVIEMQSDPTPPQPLRSVLFFPYDQGVIENARPQLLSRLSTTRGDGGYRLTIASSVRSPGRPTRLRGVMVAEPAWDELRRRALSVDVTIRNRGH